MKENCEVIRDLLPLVQDGVASEASCRMVQEHLEECEACRTFYISEPVKMPDETLDRRLVASVHKAFFFVGMALLLIGAAVGVALTDSMGMFYNFILMPGVGMLGYWLFRGKSFFVPLGGTEGRPKGALYLCLDEIMVSNCGKLCKAAHPFLVKGKGVV